MSWSWTGIKVMCAAVLAATAFHVAAMASENHSVKRACWKVTFKLRSRSELAVSTGYRNFEEEKRLEAKYPTIVIPAKRDGDFPEILVRKR